MNTIIKTLSNSDILSFAIGLLTFFSSIYFFKMTTKHKITKERYEKLIFPMFNALEPVLFKEKNAEIFQTLLILYNQNKHLAGGRITYIMYHCNNNFSNDNFISLCKVISSELDDCCNILGIKKRTIFYRLDRSQYKGKTMLVLYVISNILLLLTGPFLLFSLLYFTKMF